MVKFLLGLCDPLIIFAAINCGLAAAFNFNVLNYFSGDVARGISIIFGIAGLLKLLGFVRK
ncbi:MAG: hypothetical protein K6F04_00380 [bacterium]|nr:hypothetical protein [bacterium]